MWPVFRWSFDDAYLARLSEDTISVYETPSMNLVDKKSIRIEGVKDFSWSPSDHIIRLPCPFKTQSIAAILYLKQIINLPQWS
jgi:translation initiation factor 3 subunit B